MGKAGEPSPFRITVETALPEELVVWVPGVCKAEDKFVYLYSDVLYRPIPEELYLREGMDLDVRSDSDIVSFVNFWGNVVEASWRDLGYGPDLAGDTRGARLARAEIRRAVSGRIEQDALRKDVTQSEDWAVRWVFHIEEIRVRLARLQNLVLSWDHLRGGIDLSTLRSGWRTTAFDPVPDDDRVCARRFSRNLTAALAPFHPRVVLEDRTATPGYTTFQAMCLQLARHVAEQTPYARCNNESCRRLFVRQRGRAEYGQYHSTGVRYCTPSCAQTQAQREYRRRKQAQKLADQGLSNAQIAEKMKLSTDKVASLLEQVSKEG